MGRRLDSISISGYKSIKKLDNFKLGDLNVLIGSNGAGKSNFISLFRMLRTMFNGGLQRYVASSGGAESFFHFGTKQTDRIDLRFEFGINAFSCALKSSADDSIYIEEASAVYHTQSRDHIYPVVSPNHLELDFDRSFSRSVSGHVRDAVQSWDVFHFHDTGASSPMKKSSEVADNRGLRADASNIASYLYLLKEKHPHSYSQIVDAIRDVAPFFSGFNLEPSELNSDKISLGWTHQDSDKYFGPSSLSDGTLRYICLATLLLQPEQNMPATIVIDEPELGLHPHAIMRLAALLRRASKLRQVIVSTQSITLINHMEWRDLIIVDRGQGGVSELRRLTESEMNAWVDGFALGDIFEKNIFGGTPFLS